MTLADFIKVFDFDDSQKVEIWTGFNETYAGTYYSENQIIKDFCTNIYNVKVIRPLDEFTLQIVIWH